MAMSDRADLSRLAGHRRGDVAHDAHRLGALDLESHLIRDVPFGRIGAVVVLLARRELLGPGFTLDAFANQTGMEHIEFVLPDLILDHQRVRDEIQLSVEEVETSDLESEFIFARRDVVGRVLDHHLVDEFENDRAAERDAFIGQTLDSHVKDATHEVGEAHESHLAGAGRLVVRRFDLAAVVFDLREDAVGKAELAIIDDSHILLAPPERALDILGMIGEALLAIHRHLAAGDVIDGLRGAGDRPAVLEDLGVVGAGFTTLRNGSRLAAAFLEGRADRLEDIFVADIRCRSAGKAANHLDGVAGDGSDEHVFTSGLVHDHRVWRPDVRIVDDDLGGGGRRNGTVDCRVAADMRILDPTESGVGRTRRGHTGGQRQKRSHATRHSHQDSCSEIRSTIADDRTV